MVVGIRYPVIAKPGLSALTTDVLDASVRMVGQGRDYFYQERVGPLIGDLERGFLCGRVRGYQDEYVVSVMAHSDGLDVRCSCESTRICPHALAVIYAKEREPWAILDPSRLRIPKFSSLVWWPWMAEWPFPWDQIPTDLALMRTVKPGDEWPPALPWSGRSAGMRHQRLLDYLPLVDISWWQQDMFRQQFEQVWSDPELLGLVKRNFIQWLELVSRGPEVPLGSLWSRCGSEIAHHQNMVQRLLWQIDADDQGALNRLRAERFLELMELDREPATVQRLEMVRAAFRWADPGQLELAMFYHRMGHDDKAIAALEENLPSDRRQRETHRKLLIAFSQGPDRIGHQVADLLESPNSEKRAALFGPLSDQERERLLEAFPALIGVESNPVRE